MVRVGMGLLVIGVVSRRGVFFFFFFLKARFRLKSKKSKRAVC